MNKVKEYRLSRGLNQRELADLVGITRASVSRIENGKRNPYGPTRIVLAQALGCQAQDLWDGPNGNERNGHAT